MRGAHLRAEDESLLGEGGAGVVDGSVLYVEEGAPLRRDESQRFAGLSGRAVAEQRPPRPADYSRAAVAVESVP